MSITQKDINFIKSSNDIRNVIVSFVTNRGPVFEDQIEDWLRMEYNPTHIPAILDYWLPELEEHGEIMEKDGMWYPGTVQGELGRPRGWSRKVNELRSVVRMMILESNSKVGFKMIFLAGLPGGGKSTLVKRLGIGDQFTNCNIDNFYEHQLVPELGTADLAQVEEDYSPLEKKRRKFLDGKGPDLSSKEREEHARLADIRSRAQSMFQGAIKDFKKQVEEVCQVGSNFIIDGTAANAKRIIEDKHRYESMGYECAMIFVDIDVDTSVERNVNRGKEGGRSIANHIIRRQGKGMPENVEPYALEFGENFFLVSNRGTLQDYETAIDSIRDGVDLFLR